MKDVLTNDSGDLVIENGDFVVDYSEEQHVQDILISAPGTWKQWPTVGVGIVMRQEKGYTREALDRLKKNIKLQLMADGIRANRIEVKLTGNDIQTITINRE
jgi:hypothetical protein